MQKKNFLRLIEKSSGITQLEAERMPLMSHCVDVCDVPELWALIDRRCGEHWGEDEVTGVRPQQEESAGPEEPQPLPAQRPTLLVRVSTAACSVLMFQKGHLTVPVYIWLWQSSQLRQNCMQFTLSIYMLLSGFVKLINIWYISMYV